MITYHKENIKDFIPECKELITLHWKEIARNKDIIKLNPDYDKYIQIEDAGLLKTFTMRDGDKLIGYSIYTVMPNLHYKDSIFATNDIIFLHPDYRGCMEGARFISYIDNELKKLGVVNIIMHVKIAHDFGKLLNRLDYEEIEKVYSRLI